MRDTPNLPKAQESAGQNAQALGTTMMACVVPDVAMQNAIKVAAREAIDRHPNLSWAQKGFLGALVGRINFRTGTVQDAHEYLARWFNTSLATVRRHRDALHEAGFIIDRECKGGRFGGNLTNEITLPIVAETAQKLRVLESEHPRVLENDQSKVSTNKGKPPTYLLEQVDREKEEEERAPAREPHVVSSTSREMVPYSEASPLEGDLDEMAAALPVEVRKAVADPLVRMAVRTHLENRPREAVLQAALLACAGVAAGGVKKPVVYIIATMRAELEGSHRPAQQAGGQLPAWKAEINDRLARMRAANNGRFPADNGILRKIRDVVIQNVDGNEILDAVPGATTEQVLTALVAVETAMEKRGPGGFRLSSTVVITPASIKSKAVAQLRGGSDADAETLAEQLKRISEEEEREERRRRADEDIKRGKVGL